MELENRLLDALDSTEVYRIEGEVFELATSFEHKTWQNAGIGIGFFAIDADVDDFDPRATGTYEFTFLGVELYVPIRF